MASIRVRNNTYYLDYYDEAGKRIRRSLNLPATRENKAKALLEKKKIEFELSAGIYKEKQKRIENKNKLLNDGLNEYLASKQKLSIRTVEDYKFVFGKLVARFGNTAINKITTDKIEQWEKELKLDDVSENGIASYFKKLRVIFNYFKAAGWIEENPIPKRTMNFKDPVIIPRKDLEDILEKLKIKNRKYYKAVVLLLLTGMRISELLRLTFEDIDFRENILIIRNTKGHRADKFPLYDELRLFLLEEFPNRTGKLFDYKNKDSMKFFKHFLVKEGYKDYNFHNLRKTFISKLINSGMSVYDVMTLARHKSIQTTLRHYTAAELSRMGKEISQRANLGTLLGTPDKRPLKKLEFGT